MPGDGIGKIKTEADLERFIVKVVEQAQLNTTQSLPGEIAQIQARLKAGGL